ncbi:hypothetical protein JKF63_06938 [Porcisia hertigi]|uniref:protein-synthesizing GTPase n=1 Tax=Porcisia hertigi TaxID=2761500 RepID=A0A836LJE1_9TRYP|nr:hypothetical protein JKF63_06938 [Porcisia hertigi]
MAEEDIADFTLNDENVIDTDQGLAKQDFSKINLDELNVDTFEVMSRQATINVGTIGHVAHGKSTVVKALSGVKTQKFHREAVMNITIHLGYANAKVYQCESCPRPICFQTYPSSQPDSTPCPNCGETMTLKRHFSFVDCPGHDVLMATMLNGAAIMDAALLLIAANESFPQPQTLEHLAAAEMIGVSSLIVLQNKVDLVSREHAAAQYGIIRHYLATKTAYTKAPVIPICAQQNINMNFLLDYLVHIPLPRRQLHDSQYLSVLRSFDVSLPGPIGDVAEVLKGGVIGGTVAAGVLCVGDEIEITPGLLVLRRRDGLLPRRQDVLSGKEVTYVLSPPPGEVYAVPLRTTVVRLQAEQNELQFAVPGGLIAIGTTLDPSLTRQNKLRGQVVRVVRRGPVWRSNRMRHHAQNFKNPHAVEEAAPATGSATFATTKSTCNATPMPWGAISAHPYPTAAPCEVECRTGMQVYQEVLIQFFLLREILGLATPRRGDGAVFDDGPSAYRVHPSRMVGAKSKDGKSIGKRVQKLNVQESLQINVGTLTAGATVLDITQDPEIAKLELVTPVCCSTGEQVAISRMVDKTFRLIGWGTIRRGVPMKQSN